MEHELLLDEQLLPETVDQQHMRTEVPPLRTFLLNEVTLELTDPLLRLGYTHFINIFITVHQASQQLCRRSFVKETLATSPGEVVHEVHQVGREVLGLLALREVLDQFVGEFSLLRVEVTTELQQVQLDLALPSLPVNRT
jgi:hypothetical protein